MTISDGLCSLCVCVSVRLCVSCHAGGPVRQFSAPYSVCVCVCTCVCVCLCVCVCMSYPARQAGTAVRPCHRLNNSSGCLGKTKPCLCSLCVCVCVRVCPSVCVYPATSIFRAIFSCVFACVCVCVFVLDWMWVSVIVCVCMSMGQFARMCIITHIGVQVSMCAVYVCV